MRTRRIALWGMLVAQLVGAWGVGWDIRWHVLIGRDTFWIPPHLMTYSAVIALAGISLGVLLLETREARAGRGARDIVRVLGLVGSPGFHLAWWGMALTLAAAPIDDVWHRLVGLDVTLWSPRHLLGFAGAQVNALGCLLVAAGAWPRGSRARAAALLVSAVLLLGFFEAFVGPSIRVAFLRGGVWFFTYAIIGALVFTFTLVVAARLSGWRTAPLVVAAGAVVLQLSTGAVADTGFALLRPASRVDGAMLAADPASPIAVAHEIARRNGTRPGRSVTTRLFPLLPAALLVAVDARRRWVTGAAVFGAALLVVSGAMLARSPAHALPATSDLGPAMAFTLVASLGGGACAARCTDFVLARRPGVAATLENMGGSGRPPSSPTLGAPRQSRMRPSITRFVHRRAG